MAERIPPLTPRQSRSVAVYEDKKRLAEMAWAALLVSPRHVTDGFDNIAAQAWNAAEIMHLDSKRRRPVE